MAQTKEGAIKAAAKRVGLTPEEYTQKLSHGEKYCYKCGIWKIKATDFHPDKSRSDGSASICKSCRAAPDPYASLRGRVSTFKGKTHSDAAKAKMSAAHKGKPSAKKGHARTAKDRAAIQTAVRAVKDKFSGPNHYNWKGGITPLNKTLRKGTEYADWRLAVFKRDNFTCCRCKDNRGGNLHAHHVKSFADHPTLRFDVSNGETLCHDCHEKHHGWRIGRTK